MIRNSKKTIRLSTVSMFVISLLTALPSNLYSSIVNQGKYSYLEEKYKNLFEYDISNYTRKKVISQSIDYFPTFRILDHTMCFSLDHYVEQKLPTELFHKAVLNEWKIEVHGIFPSLFSANSKNIGFDAVEEINFIHNKREKRYNYIRPKYYIGYRLNEPNTLIISVTPGEDYIYHYASMIRHYLNKLTRNGEKRFEVHRYPYLEERLAEWTQLDQKFIKANDIVILGNVDELRDLFLKQDHLRLISHYENQYYESTRYKLPNDKIINFFGVKFSYWGCISAKLVSQLCRLGTKEIIYSAKLGSLTRPGDLYGRIYSPTKYMTMRAHKVTKFITNLPNKFVQLYPEFDTDWHVSIPTVLEEDFGQREIATQIGAQSIDNEISRMAAAVEEFNKGNNKNVSFFSVHYATDYVRRKEEKCCVVPHDLSTNRTDEAVNAKKNVLEKISINLLKYLLSSS